MTTPGGVNPSSAACPPAPTVAPVHPPGAYLAARRCFTCGAVTWRRPARSARNLAVLLGRRPYLVEALSPANAVLFQSFKECA